MRKRAFRKTLSIFMLPVCILLLGSPMEAQQLPPETWSQFRGGHQLLGVSVSNVPRDLKLLWTYEAGESIESSAAIVNGVVYVGSQSGELAALNLSNGSVRWKYRATGPIGESSPCVAGGVVFIGDLNGTLHAVSARDGKALWTFKTNAEIKSSPVVVGDRVLIGSYDENLYCIAVSNGSLIWKFRTGGPVHCAAGVANGMAHIAGCDETFRAIRIADGKEVFHIASGAYTGASPALVGQKAFYGTFNNEVIAVNLATRRIAWRYRNRQRQFPYYSSAGVIEGRVVVGGRDKMVHCLDAATGKELWTFMTRARVESSPALADGRVFIGSNDGNFYVLDYKTGAKVWEFNAGAPLSASPAIASGRVVIGSEDGRLYCFGQ
ncbi:MAG: PQQ-binding-like beta-propeller repeat protein [Acidobacteriota bacterium]